MTSAGGDQAAGISVREGAWRRVGRPVLLAVLAGSVAFWGTRLAVRHRPARAALCSLGGGTHLKPELGLDDRQVAALSTLEKDLAGQLSDLCGQYCAARAELADALARENSPSVQASHTLVNRMCDLQAASEVATLNHIRKVSALLTPEQRRRFLSSLTQCLCGSDGLCAGGCMDRETP
ncbi:MAG: periplasmic heavy metal sensor [bacterium]